MEMFSDILSKERSVGETENTRNLLYRLARRSQIISNIRKGVLSYPVNGSLAGMPLAHDGQIFWGDAQLLGKILHRLMLDLALLQQFKELVEKVACRGRSVFIILLYGRRKIVAQRQQCTLEQRLNDFAAIGIPRCKLHVVGIETKTHQVGKLGIEEHFFLCHLHHRNLVNIHGTIPDADMRVQNVLQT